LKSCTGSFKPITCDSLYIHAYKYYAATGRQPIVDKSARKRFFSLKRPVKTFHAQKKYPLTKIPWECVGLCPLLGYNFLEDRPFSSGNKVDRKVPSIADTPKELRQPFVEAVVNRSGSYALPQLSSYRGSSHECVLHHHAIQSITGRRFVKEVSTYRWTLLSVHLRDLLGPSPVFIVPIEGAAVSIMESQPWYVFSMEVPLTFIGRSPIDTCGHAE